MNSWTRLLSLWLLLGGLSGLLTATSHDHQAGFLAASALVLLLPVAVWLTAQAIPRLPRWRPVRLAFLTLTFTEWFVLLSIAGGQAEVELAGQPVLWVAFGFGGAAAVWLLISRRSLWTRRGIVETTAALATVVLLFGLAAGAYEFQTRSLFAQAKVRWAEIGLPIDRLEETFVPGRENEGSDILREILRSRVNSHFYRDRSQAADREAPIDPSASAEKLLSDTRAILAIDLPAADDIDLSTHPAAEIEAMAPALEADYRRILATDPPAWTSDSHDGYAISVPNFLGLRFVSQLCAADALRRLAAGDQAGAALALDAGQHIRQGARKSPTLVSVMINVAIDALLSSKQVRLPATGHGLEALAEDAPKLRAEFLESLRLEAWAAMRFENLIADQQVAVQSKVSPGWAARFITRLWARRECANAVLSGAEHAAIEKSPATLALPDLGRSLHQAITARRESIMDVNTPRASMRLHATLLLREQAELIRDARARLAAGQPVASVQSVVLPAVRWERIADPEKNTVSTRLVNAPPWIVSNEVTGEHFWLLPIDGSGAWQFRAPLRAASRE